MADTGSAGGRKAAWDLSAPYAVQRPPLLVCLVKFGFTIRCSRLNASVRSCTGKHSDDISTSAVKHLHIFPPISRSRDHQSMPR